MVFNVARADICIQADEKERKRKKKEGMLKTSYPLLKTRGKREAFNGQISREFLQGV